MIGHERVEGKAALGMDENKWKSRYESKPVNVRMENAGMEKESTYTKAQDDVSLSM